jgi:hypothetical protein
MASIWSPSRDIVIVDATPPVSASPNYTSGDSMGGVIAFANAVEGSHMGGGGIIQHVRIVDAAAQALQIDVVFFRADPAASTFTDNALAVINAADAVQIIDFLPMTSWFTHTRSYSSVRNLSVPFVLSPGSSTLYCALIARGAHDLAATTDIHIRVGIMPV